MRYVAVGLVVAVVVVLAMGPLVLGRRQVAHDTGRPFDTSGLVAVAIVVALLAAGLGALTFAVRPSVVVMASAGLALAIAALILVRARGAPGTGLPKVPTLLFLLAGGLMAAIGVAALLELLPIDPP